MCTLSRSYFLCRIAKIVRHCRPTHAFIISFFFLRVIIHISFLLVPLLLLLQLLFWFTRIRSGFNNLNEKWEMKLKRTLGYDSIIIWIWSHGACLKLDMIKQIKIGMCKWNRKKRKSRNCTVSTNESIWWLARGTATRSKQLSLVNNKNRSKPKSIASYFKFRFMQMSSSIYI